MRVNVYSRHTTRVHGAALYMSYRYADGRFPRNSSDRPTKNYYKLADVDLLPPEPESDPRTARFMQNWSPIRESNPRPRA